MASSRMMMSRQDSASQFRGHEFGPNQHPQAATQALQAQQQPQQQPQQLQPLQQAQHIHQPNQPQPQHQHQHQITHHQQHQPKTRGRKKKIRTEPIRPICPQCEKQFSNQSALTKHKLTHSDERKFACHQCSKAFKRHDHLTGHMQTHSNRKPYNCNIQGCDKTYCDARSLRRHKENIHHIVTPKESNFKERRPAPTIDINNNHIDPPLYSTTATNNNNNNNIIINNNNNNNADIEHVPHSANSLTSTIHQHTPNHQLQDRQPYSAGHTTSSACHFTFDFPHTSRNDPPIYTSNNNIAPISTNSGDNITDSGLELNIQYKPQTIARLPHLATTTSHHHHHHHNHQQVDYESPPLTAPLTMPPINNYSYHYDNDPHQTQPHSADHTTASRHFTFDFPHSSRHDPPIYTSNNSIAPISTNSGDNITDSGLELDIQYKPQPIARLPHLTNHHNHQQVDYESPPLTAPLTAPPMTNYSYMYDNDPHQTQPHSADHTTASRHFTFDFPHSSRHDPPIYASNNSIAPISTNNVDNITDSGLELDIQYKPQTIARLPHLTNHHHHHHHNHQQVDYESPPLTAPLTAPPMNNYTYMYDNDPHQTQPHSADHTTASRHFTFV